jgi:hypothetical protein
MPALGRLRTVAGLTHGPGFARVLADHIVAGASPLTSLEPWRLDRFDGAYASDARDPR